MIGGASASPLSAIPGVGPIMTGLKAVGTFSDMFGPQGSVTRGDIGSAIQGGQSLYNAGQNLGQSVGLFGAPEQTVMSEFGLSPEEFNTIPPEVRQEMLRKLRLR